MLALLRSLSQFIAARFPQVSASTVTLAVLHALEAGITGSALKDVGTASAAAAVTDPAQQDGLIRGMHSLVDFGEAYHAAKLAEMTAPAQSS